MERRSFVACRAELLGAGFTTDRISNWIVNGRLVRLLRGVYSYGRDVESAEAAWRAGLVAAGEGSMLTGSSACELWGIVESKRDVPLVVEVAVARGETRTLPGSSPALRRTEFRFVRRRLQPGDGRTKDGLATVAPVLALRDFAAEASTRDVRFAFLEACRRRLVRRRDIEALHCRITGRPGASRLRPLLALWVPELGRTRSVFEGSFLLACVDGGLPLPEVNVKVGGYEVDCYWPDHGLVVELDGRAYHGDPAQRAIDRMKQKEIESRGLTVLRITYREFEANPKEGIELVRRHLDL